MTRSSGSAVLAAPVFYLQKDVEAHDTLLELHHRTLERSGVFAAARLQREHRQAQRYADAYHYGRADQDWQSRMTTSKGAMVAENKAAVEDAAKRMQRLRDSAPAGSDVYHKAHAEFLRLCALRASA